MTPQEALEILKTQSIGKFLTDQEREKVFKAVSILTEVVTQTTLTTYLPILESNGDEA